MPDHEHPALRLHPKHLARERDLAGHADVVVDGKALRAVLSDGVYARDFTP